MVPLEETAMSIVLVLVKIAFVIIGLVLGLPLLVAAKWPFLRFMRFAGIGALYVVGATTLVTVEFSWEVRLLITALIGCCVIALREDVREVWPELKRMSGW